MQQVLSAFQQALRQPGQLGLGENEDKAFAAHFPDLVPLRDEWNAAVMRAADAPSGVEHWLERECRALGEADDRCDSDAVLAALRGVVASTDYGRKGYVLTYDGWTTFPQDDTIKLIQRDARSVQREVAVLPAEPADTARDRCNAVIESINDIFVRAQQTSEWAEVGDALAARDGLVHSTNARVMLHLGAPLFVTEGCPFCDTQARHRRGNA